ncbi:hypothetical protein PHLGIDRAFT_350085 [Phlebiopsis gigantea 11061_1 CR5-6]|uniref:Heterokaryon incompatibility domain-containing protein n=1 Tax=Phlebiopsis gigantea (strain 11061_1 CR5-6) TaxID=745531 RepID=A0A0C3S1I8_PHLG1|nr:hypothetical protein PHLGIDRAFT_350085 [Phlebiopsis gigantea 11061_1 CR5-6]
MGRDAQNRRSSHRRGSEERIDERLARKMVGLGLSPRSTPPPSSPLSSISSISSIPPSVLSSLHNIPGGADLMRDWNLNWMFSMTQGHDISQRVSGLIERPLQALRQKPARYAPEGAKVFTFEGGTKEKPPLIQLQQSYTGRLALNHRYQTLSCDDMSVEDLLKRLNDVLGTTHTLDTPGLSKCLQEYLDESCDFGQVYSYLRPWWNTSNFEDVPQFMNQRKVQDTYMREQAIRGDTIIQRDIPPRRLWDLFSNRVIPFHVLNIPQPDFVPPNVWAVSHSWVKRKTDLRYVSSRINNEEWRVPLPRHANLHDIRIELLNLGAEYVFLDVLCLRQEDSKKPGKEYQRKKEWRLDVPTIGQIYRRPGQTVIIYFNGLGLPFTITSDALDSDFHWLNRVWTLQEIGHNIIAGGLCPTSFKQKEQKQWRKFLDAMYELFQMTSENSYDLFKLIDNIQIRKSSNPIDRIHGLVYLLGCTTLPIYDEDLTEEDVWGAIIERMTPTQRTSLLVGWGSRGDELYDWRPSWGQLWDCDWLHKIKAPLPLNLDPAKIPQYAHLEHLPQAGRIDQSDVFCHGARVIRICDVALDGDPTPDGSVNSEDDEDDEDEESEESEDDEDEEDDHKAQSRQPPGDGWEGTVTINRGPKHRDVEFTAAFQSSIRRGRYTLISVADLRNYLVVGRVVGKRRIPALNQVAYVISKRSVIKIAEKDMANLESKKLFKLSAVVYCGSS